MRVAIAIITFHRPEGLKRLLESLNRLEFRTLQPPEVTIVVVDNDASGSAHAYCQEIQATMKWTLISCIEPRRGIAVARNTSINLALKDADYVASIDDDEFADPMWLEELLRVAQTYEADVVAGVVLPEFEPGIPDWIQTGDFFRRPRFLTGERLHSGATCNVLLRAEVIRKMGKIFDEQFSLTGGEDTHFFIRVDLAGYKMVFANEAVVHEFIPAARANAKWLVMRAYGHGSVLSRCERDLMPSLKRRCLRLAVGFGKMGQGMCHIVPGCFRDPQRLVKGLRHFSRGMGMIAGLFGAQFQQYGKTDGK